MKKIDELRRIKDEIAHLRDEQRRLSVPTVVNMGMIYNLYEVFKLVLKQQDPKSEPTDTTNRKKFLYAILYLCSPQTLVGEVMKHKLREYLAKVIDCTPTCLSRDYKTALFFYHTYKEFKDSVDDIIENMLYVLGEN